MTSSFRQALYALSTVATGILTLLVTFRIIEQGTATNLTTAIAALVGLFGTAATGTATAVVSKQRKEGTLNFQGTAADQAVSAIQATVAQAAGAAKELDKVKTAATEALTQITDGSLVAQLIDSVRRH